VAFAVLSLASSPVAARTLEVVTTSSSGAVLVHEVAGSHARIKVLGPPDRDLHYLQVRPSMMRALRSADLLVAVGADLEIGWLPVAIRQAANPAIQPGKPGYFEFAAHVELVDVGGAADRSLGDVHPQGNPHVHMDPVRMIALAEALADRLRAFDPEHASHFDEHADYFADIVRARLPEWRQRLIGASGAVLYHQDANYLFYRFDVPIHGYLEPVPGIPPSASHIKQLTSGLQGKRGIVLYNTFQPPNAPKSLARSLGWKTRMMRLEPPLDSTGADYVAHIESWVAALENSGE
jgi:zinc/manganese transport system substrate-binding protein